MVGLLALCTSCSKGDDTFEKEPTPQQPTNTTPPSDTTPTTNNDNNVSQTKRSAEAIRLLDYLKSIYYRFVDEGEEYKAAYDKYNKIVKEGL